MKKLFALCLATVSLLGASSVATLAGPPKAEKKTAVVDVWHCPITGEAVSNKADKGTVVGAYRAHFCCAGCPETFAKLSPKEQKAKMVAAAKKEKAEPKKG